MKKAIFLLPILLLSSCQSTTVERIPLLTCPVAFENDGERQRLSWNCGDVLADMIERKASFALFVYVPGCSTCETFTYYVDSFLARTNALLPYCIYGDYASATGSHLENSSIVLYRDGILAETFDFTTAEESFNSFMENNVMVLPVDFLSVHSNPDFSSAFYPSYELEPCVTTVEEDILPVSPFLEMTSKDKGNILYIQTDLVSDFTEFSSSLPSLSLDGIAAIDEDIERLDNNSFKQVFGFEKGEAESGFTYVDYSNDSVFSASSIADLLELVNLRK